jgi:internalin A
VLGGLKDLEITGSKMTVEGLTHLVGLARLEGLDVSGSRTTDAGLVKLSRLSNLKTLDLSGTAVSDDGLMQLDDLVAGFRVDPCGFARRPPKLPGAGG